MANYYRSTIQKGSQGEDVLNWQKFLQSQGYDFSEYGGTDGIFGDATDRYTRDWQQKNGIGVDGIVGETTWGKAGYTPYSAISTPTDLPEFDTTPNDTAPTGSNILTDSYGANGETSAQKAYNSALAALNKHVSDGFTFSEQEWLKKVKEEIEKYLDKPFSYNFNEDAMYQQAVDRYSQMGKMAMQDTMGQAAAMTGGYGNSYAQSVGQQTYQNYLQEAHDMLPEFYQMALDRYNMGKEDLYNQYGMLLSEYEREYGLYSDEYNQLLDALGIAQENLHHDEEMYYTGIGLKNDAEIQRFNEKLALYNVSEEARKYFNTLLQQGYTMKEAARLAGLEEYWRQYEAEHGSSDSGSDNSGSDNSGSDNSGSDNGGNKGVTPDGVEYDNGSVSTEDIIAMQEAIGVGADGYWGPKSTEAADGLTADEAYEAWKNGELGNSGELGNEDWTTNDQSKVEENQKEYGGSYYATAVSDLQTMKSQGLSYDEAVDFVKELLDSSYITKSEYNTLVQKIRNMWY